MQKVGQASEVFSMISAYFEKREVVPVACTENGPTKEYAAAQISRGDKHDLTWSLTSEQGADVVRMRFFCPERVMCDFSYNATTNDVTLIFEAEGDAHKGTPLITEKFSNELFEQVLEGFIAHHEKIQTIVAEMAAAAV